MFKHFLWLFLCTGLLTASIHCKEEDAISSPCDAPILLEDIRPGVGSLQKLPYRNGQVLRMADQNGHMVEIGFGSLQTLEEYREDPTTCEEDSSLIQKVQYNILRHLLQGNTTEPGPLRSISFELIVLYNTLDPLANERAELLVLKVSAKEKDPAGIELISIPLSNSNYPFQIPQPNIMSSLRMGSREFQDVYTGQVEELNGLKAYFTLNEGLIRLQDSTGWSWSRME